MLLSDTMAHKRYLVDRLIDFSISNCSRKAIHSRCRVRRLRGPKTLPHRASKAARNICAPRRVYAGWAGPCLVERRGMETSARRQGGFLIHGQYSLFGMRWLYVESRGPFDAQPSDAADRFTVGFARRCAAVDRRCSALLIQTDSQGGKSWNSGAWIGQPSRASNLSTKSRE